MTTSTALEWVPMNRYCELFGEASDAVDKRLRSGYWLRDVRIRHPEGSKQRCVKLKAAHAWAASPWVWAVTSRRLPPTGGIPDSPSGGCTTSKGLRP